MTPATSPATSPALGIDVSHHQNPGRIDWSALAEVGYAFAYVRATYGTRVDRAHDEHMRRADADGLFVGSYHFWRPGPASDLDEFMHASLAGPHTLRPAIDVEGERGRPLTRADADGVLAAIDRIHPCVIYTSRKDWAELGNPAWPVGCILWVAHYPRHARPVADPYTLRPGGPSLPVGGPRNCAIWQHEGRATLPEPAAARAVHGANIDRNVCFDLEAITL